MKPRFDQQLPRATRPRAPSAMAGPLGLTIASLVWLALPGNALAQHGGGSGRVAVVASGRGSGGAAATLVSSLANAGLDVMSASEFARAARGQGVSRRGLGEPSGIQAAAGAVGVDCVLVVRMMKKGRRKALDAKLYDSSGQRIWSHKQRIRRGGPKPRGLRKLVAGVKRRIPAPAEVAEPQEAPPPPESQEPAPESPGDADQAGGPYSAYAQAEPSADESPSEDSDSDSDDSRGGYFGRASVKRRASSSRRGSGSGLPLVAARLLAGTGRRQYLAQGPNLKLSYSTSFYLESGFQAELYPLRSLNRFLRGIGVEAGFARGFISSRYNIPVDGEARSGVTSTPVHKLYVDGCYRFRLSDSWRWSPTLGARVGWGITDFQVALPNSSFRGVRHFGLRIGGDVTQPLLPDLASLSVGGFTAMGQNVGSAQTDLHGALVSSTGWGLRLGLSSADQKDPSGFTWGLWAEILDNSDTFATQSAKAGQTGQSTAAVSKAAAANASARERYVAAYASAGYAF